MTQEIKDKLNLSAKENLPDRKFLDHTNGWSEADKILYLKLVEIYNDLCKDDVTFSLSFVTNDGFHPMNFYRICELDEENRMKVAGSKLFFTMYKELYYSGYLHSLESAGFLKLTDKLGMKTYAEEQNIKLEDSILNE